MLRKTEIAKRSQKNLIIVQSGETLRLTLRTVGDTYSDWYLPSFLELTHLENLFKLKSEGSPIANTFYWSSSEMSKVLACGISWSPATTTGINTKSDIYRVRAFRSF